MGKLIISWLVLLCVTMAVSADRGYITNYGNKYMWSGTGEAFVPNFVMLGTNDGPLLDDYTQSSINSFLDDMFDENGFNGVHVPVYGQWFHIGNRVVSGSDNTLDQTTFNQLKMIIQTVYARGGAVHLWAWGDDARSWSPSKLSGGIMGSVEKKVWDKVYAELNDLPGWTIGYGFDLHEWVSSSQLKAWHDYCHAKPGWKHLMGARAQKNVIDQIYGGLDYNGYENHKPRYDLFVQMLEDAGSKPAFSEDRFRVRGRDKDPTTDESRLMMWDATMAGGVAGIWGYLGSETGTSRSYPNADQMLCYGTFWKNRFLKNMVRDNSGTNGYGLRNGTSHYVYYKENASSLSYAVSGGAKTVIAVDCKKAYAEIPVGTKADGSHTFSAPYTSDWVLAIGTFDGDTPPDPPVLNSIEVQGTGMQLLTGGTMQFTAAAYDQYGALLDPQPALSWTASGAGSINSSGLFTAGNTAGTGSITATAGSTSGSTTVMVVTEITEATVTLAEYHGTALAPEIITGGFTEDAAQCNDRTPVPAWTDIPPELDGLTYLLNARDDKKTSGTLYTVNLSAPCLVYVLIDDDAGIPSWISTEKWETAGYTLNGAGQPYSVYKKSFTAGDHDLQTQHDNSSEGTGYVFDTQGGTTVIYTRFPGGFSAMSPSCSTGNKAMYSINGRRIISRNRLRVGIYLVQESGHFSRILIH